METRHTLFKTMGAKTVCPRESLSRSKCGLPTLLTHMSTNSIIRILFMVPIYSIVSFVSFVFYRHAIYFEVIRDCYEAFAIASFFSLLCHYIAPDLHSQKDYFRGITPKNWVLPISWLQHGCCGNRDHGPWRIPKSGLTWFNVCLPQHGWISNATFD